MVEETRIVATRIVANAWLFKALEWFKQRGQWRSQGKDSGEARVLGNARSGEDVGLFKEAGQFTKLRLCGEAGVVRNARIDEDVGMFAKVGMFKALGLMKR